MAFSAAPFSPARYENHQEHVSGELLSVRKFEVGGSSRACDTRPRRDRGGTAVALKHETNQAGEIHGKKELLSQCFDNLAREAIFIIECEGLIRWANKFPRGIFHAYDEAFVWYFCIRSDTIADTGACENTTRRFES
ncbi:hypothetical protein ABW19_dt0206532 [Dactylella cylindrospora]|nr:hypothetical protein ABW19_dt0206532 [Dactylella cylindrospora]